MSARGLWRFVVEVDGVCFEDVVAIYRSGVDVLVEFAGVEWGVVEVVDGEATAIWRMWPVVEGASAHKVLSEGHLCVEAKAEAAVPVSATRGPTTASAPEARGVGVGVVVVARHCFRGRVGRLRYIS